MVDTAIRDAARRLSELGASKGGKARSAKLSTEKRTAIARKAAQTRWQKVPPRERVMESEVFGDIAVTPIERGVQFTILTQLPDARLSPAGVEALVEYLQAYLVGKDK